MKSFQPRTTEFSNDLTNLVGEISSLCQDLNSKRNLVDDLGYSVFHERFAVIKLTKRNLHNAMLSILARNAALKSGGRPCGLDLKPLLVRLDVVESKFRYLFKLMYPGSAMDHLADVIKAIERDLEANFCLLRRIRCNLPYHQNWMHFLSQLTERDRGAALAYYKVALKEVRKRGRCISTVHRLLDLLKREEYKRQSYSKMIAHLDISNTSCEALCYDIWLRLLEMIMYLEKLSPRKMVDKSTISAYNHLLSWKRGISDGRPRVWKAKTEDFLSERHKSAMWFSCLSDRLLLQEAKQESLSPHASLERGHESTLDKRNLKSAGGSVHSCKSNECQVDNTMEDNGDLPESEAPREFESLDGFINDDGIGDVPSSNGYAKFFSRGSGFRIVPPLARSSGPTYLSRTEPQRVFRSPASISHSEAKRAIAEMTTGSDIIGTPSPEMILRVPKDDSDAARRLDSYLAAAEAAEMFVAQQHSNSNVEISGNLRRSYSDDYLLKTALARARSLNDLNGPHTDKTISVSHSLEDTTTYPCELSEHLISAWDNYQVPFYSTSEGIDPLEPKAKLSEALFWEDLFPDETEALDFAPGFGASQDITRQIDEWSFEGLSGTPPSSIGVDEIADGNDEGTDASDALLEPAEKDSLSETDPVSPPPREEPRYFDKCLQAEVNNFSGHSMVQSMNTSHTALVHDTNTTHTSGYESGPDIVNSLFHQTSSFSVDGSVTVPQQEPASPPTRHCGVQTSRTGRCQAVATIREESSEKCFYERDDCEELVQSRQDLLRMRQFLQEILSSVDVCSDSSSLHTLLNRRGKRTKFSSAYSGPRSTYNLLKSFSCMLESAKRNAQALETSSDIEPGHREALFKQWGLLSGWISKRAQELREVNTHQERLQELSTKTAMLRRISAVLPHQSVPKNKNFELSDVQTLVRDCQTVIDESEVLKDALTRKKLRVGHDCHLMSPNASELSDLESLFCESLGKMLDRCIADARSLGEEAGTTKSTIDYLNNLTERLQPSEPLKHEKAQCSEASASGVSGSFRFPDVERPTVWKGQVRRQITFCMIFLFLLTYIILPLSFLPFRCERNIWPGCCPVRVYRVGVPPQ